METSFQPSVGADGKKIEFESNVLLAAIENMQYAVTVDVLHTVFSSCGAVQKIAIFEKNGGTQALIQYPDIATATVAKEALEGHCIYDGGYCKLHLSYSRHTDLNIKAYSDKSRDFTAPLPPAVQPAPVVSASTAAWSNPQAASNATQSAPWDPPGTTGRPQFVSAPVMYPGQTYAQGPPPAYGGAATVPPGSSPQPYNFPPGAPHMRGSQASHQPNRSPYGS